MLLKNQKNIKLSGSITSYQLARHQNISHYNEDHLDEHCAEMSQGHISTGFRQLQWTTLYGSTIVSLIFSLVYQILRYGE